MRTRISRARDDQQGPGLRCYRAMVMGLLFRGKSGTSQRFWLQLRRRKSPAYPAGLFFRLSFACAGQSQFRLCRYQDLLRAP